MGHAFNGEFFQSGKDRFYIQAGRGDDGFAQGFAVVEFRVQIRIVALDDFAYQRIAVGVCSVGSQAQNNVSGLNAATVDDAFFFNHADGKTGQVVFAFGIHTWHFGSFTTNQSATGFFAALGNAFNHISRAGNIQFAASEIVQEEQRFCTLNQNIVDAHGNQIDTDGIVFIPVECQFQLGADAVRTGNQYWVFVFFADFDQSAETAQITQHFRAHSTLGKRFDVFDQLIACVDIHACVTIAQRSAHWISLFGYGGRLSERILS